MLKQLIATGSVLTCCLGNPAMASQVTAEFDADMSASCSLTADNTGTLVLDGRELTTQLPGGEPVMITADVLGDGYKIRTGGSSFTTTVDGVIYDQAWANVRWDNGNSQQLRTGTGTLLSSFDKAVPTSQTLELDLTMEAKIRNNGLIVPGQYKAELALTCLN